MTSKKQGHEKAMNARGMIITAVVLVAFVSSAPLALAAAELTINPEDATVGDSITINGTGFGSNETVTIRTTVTCWKPVVDYKCECTMVEFELPEETDITLSVREVEDNVTLHIKVLLMWLTIDSDNPLGFIFTYDHATHTSDVSRNNVPAGTYTIDVIGDASDSEENCTMITSAVMEVTADGDGNFTETISTKGIPICNFTINATSAAGSDEAPLNLFLEGDASKDGQRNAYDCCCIARYWAELSGYDNSTICFDAADINDNGAVELVDAQLLAECLIGLRDWSEILP